MTWNLIDPLSFIFRSRREKKKKGCFHKNRFKKEKVYKTTYQIVPQEVEHSLLNKDFSPQKGRFSFEFAGQKEGAYLGQS